MHYSLIQMCLFISAITLGTMLTRFTPFLLFPEKKEPPKIISELGQVLPPCMMGLLVIYCLRNISFTSSSHAIPELVSILVVVLLHKWKNNTLFSIAVGTCVYMFFIQVIF